MKEESGGKKVDQYCEIYMWERERTLYLILSFVLNQWRYSRIGIMWWNLWVSVTARAAELRTIWRRLVCVAGRLSRRDLQKSILEWMREVAMVQAIVWSIVLRMRLRSQILGKHDLKTTEICCANDRFCYKRWHQDCLQNQQVRVWHC